jgi:SAM-dependent methyltransferase
MAWFNFSEKAPEKGKLNFGDLRTTTPVNSQFAYGRGQSIDRYYIENFLEKNKADIKGRVLEIGNPTYTRKYGGGNVSKSDVLHAAAGNTAATIVMDIVQAGEAYPDTFDCVIFTQTMLCIFDVKDAATALYKILKPGGVLLASFPGISQISRYDMEKWGDYWRFTDLSVKRLFEGLFGNKNIEIKSYGNVLTSVSFLHGIAAEELTAKELEYTDPDYQLSITLRAKK